jgi:hypothetical protein
MLYTRISRGQNLGLFFFFFWVLCVRMIFILSKYAVFVVIRICVIMMYRLRYYVCGCRWCLGWVIKSLGTLRSLPRVRVGCFRLLEWSRQARLIYAQSGSNPSSSGSNLTGPWSNLDSTGSNPHCQNRTRPVLATSSCNLFHQFLSYRLGF